MNQDINQILLEIKIIKKKLDKIEKNQYDILESNKRQEIHNSFLTKLYFIFKQPITLLHTSFLSLKSKSITEKEQYFEEDGPITF